MSYVDENPYAASYGSASFAAFAGEAERTTFIRRTYLHLTGAVLAFIGIEMAIFQLAPDGLLEQTTRWMVGGWHWAIVLGAFLVVSTIANRWALTATSLALQYTGLAIYVVAEAIIFIPLLLIAQQVGGPNVIMSAGLMTVLVFSGLTAIVFLTRADFSWLGRYLAFAGLVALGFIFGSIFIGFDLGMFFSGLMVALAGAYILYYTSNVLHHYRLDQYVAASLALFASVALLFWYILELFMSRR